MRNKKGLFFLTGGALLLAAALSLALYNLWDDNRAGTEPQQALEILQQLPAAAEPLTERRQDAPAASGGKECAGLYTLPRNEHADGEN